MASDVEHLFMCLICHLYILFSDCFVVSFDHFLAGLFILLMLFSLYILGMNPLSHMCFANTVDLHYSCVLYLQIYLLTKIYFWAPKQYTWCFCGHLWTLTGQWKMSAPWCTHSQLRLNKAMFCLLINKCPFHGLCSATFFTSLCFLLAISLFKIAPNVVLKCCLMFLSTRMLWCALEENMCIR